MKQLDDFLMKQFNKIFWLLSGICLVLYLILIGGDYIWVDEAYTLAMVKKSFADIRRITATDVHPPLYYWYLKILTAPFKYSMAAAKVASILPYMFIIIFGGKRIRKCFNERTAILFMWGFFLFPFALSYSIEIRMYSLASAFVFACAIFAYSFWIEPGNIKNIVGQVISGVLAAYTHDYAFVSVCIIYGLLFIFIFFKRRKLGWKWLKLVIVSIVLYSPWISTLFSQLVYKAKNEYWIEEITLRTILRYAYDLFGAGGWFTYSLFIALTYLICFIWILAGKNKKDIAICICCLFVPVGTLTIGLLVSIIVRPVFVIRYIVPSLPLLITFMAIVLGKLNNNVTFSIILTIILLGGISNYGITLYEEYTNHNYVPIDEYDNIDAYVVIGNNHIAGTLAYYDTETSIYYGDNISANEVNANRRKICDFDTDNVDKAILLLWEETIPYEFYNSYDIEYLGQWKCELDTDAYLMIKK